jgi:hypothetical protein
MRDEIGYTVDYTMPWELRLFTLYWLIVTIILAVRSIKLAWQLWSVLTASRYDPKTVTPASLAALALRNKFMPQLAATEPESKELQSLIQQAGSSFRRKWELCFVQITAIKNMASLTVALSALAFVRLFMHRMSNITLAHGAVSAWQLQAITDEALITLFMGLTMYVAAYVVIGLCEGTLLRRKTAWNFYYGEANWSK